MSAKQEPSSSAGPSSSAVKAEPKREDGVANGDAPPALTVPTEAPGFRDIPLYSVDPGQWSYHLMKFASHTAVEPGNAQHFTPPVKLNRKFPPRPKVPHPKPGDPVLNEKGKRMYNPDGTPLVWPDVADETQMSNARAAVAEPVE